MQAKKIYFCLQEVQAYRNTNNSSAAIRKFDFMEKNKKKKEICLIKINTVDKNVATVIL